MSAMSPVQPSSSDASDWTHHTMSAPSGAASLHLQQFQQLQQLQQPLQQQISVMRQQPFPASGTSSPRGFPHVSIVHQQHFNQQAYVQSQQQQQQQQHHSASSPQPHSPTQSNQQRILGTAYTPEQREALEEIFSVWDTFTKQQEREETFALSKKIGLTTIQIRGWIQNRKKRGQYKGKQVLAPEQVRILEWVFVNHSNYPSVKLKQKLACELGLKYSRIRTWFQSRRQRGVPAVLTRIPQENDMEWNETVQKLRSIIEAVKVEDAFFLRFPFKGSEDGSSGADSPSLEGSSLKSRPLTIPDGVLSQTAPRTSSKMVNSPTYVKDTRNLPTTSSFSPPSSLPARPASLNFPPGEGFPLNLLSSQCELQSDPQKRKMNYMWKGNLEALESPKKRRMTQIPSKGASAPASFISSCPQQMSSTTAATSPVPALPSWRENLARLSLEASPARSPTDQPLPRLQLPSQFSPEISPVSPKGTSAFASSDPGVATTSSWTASAAERTSDRSTSSPSSNDEIMVPKSLNQDTNSSAMPLLPSIRELERAADRSSFSMSQMQ
uniref:Homeobox domain-containing protein n=1 Tax=Paramoeba aestuarina TaxID=180227 RepID=A0A7S4P9J9_9EUKA|mmetsp:Transcript_38247/g.60553  ORF Transcript_38247/g.60553 Transcript_38247/m.60553 type:complete len:553 (+) Transcript_38247:69-1727(+)|eukprot:CAMPEP_0201523016 /NCGR_PEP_ID=MMETSP0161_2-20130828/18692_1 /ASSEMBLY_ACC=CAM_ASM_000251 /TAXON_ID=180227 /ORGANISM="Neoparamoeba aestuarina, Strain SoJaBio B1-5/56/2" /LENGTH=552 /DNA_ID=CAMNT_0047922005 /DNA_START=30 /DNA_END=1688 /DNA_ORIENTATION=-